MPQTNDEQTPNHVGRTVHVPTEGGCRTATITALLANTSFVHVDDEERPRMFDRAREGRFSWHYADHGLWRDVNAER